MPRVVGGRPGPGRLGSGLGGNQGGGWVGGGARRPGPGPAWGLGKATYSQAKLPTVRQSYPLSGKQRTVVRQSYLLSGKQRTVVRQSKDSQASTQPFHRLAPNIRILCTQPFPHTCTQMFPHTCTQNPYTYTQEFPHTCTQEFPHTCI